MTELPAPLVPIDCDLRCYDWFPFYHKRLLKSEFWKRASDAACRISVELWSEAYLQVPAASLPDDDYDLSDWAGFGRRNLEPWLALKAEVMSAWVKCSDGRWYQPVLADVANVAWAERQVHLWQRECDRIRKENKRRASDGNSPIELPRKPVFQGSSSGSDDISAGKPQLSAGRPEESDPDPPDVLRADAEIPAENALTVRTVRDIEDISSEAKASSESVIRIEAARARRQAVEGGVMNALVAGAVARGLKQAAKPAKAKAAPSTERLEQFDRWWAEYPRKAAKPAALKALCAALDADKIAFDLLLKRTVAFAASRASEDPKFTPHPASWLNAERWNDELPAPGAGGWSDRLAAGNRPNGRLGGWTGVGQAYDLMEDEQ